ncbi:xylulokinase [Hirschia litorea]|uniref:Xylulose kinase n=1 Tax=Hirschia litorea TaxID=1199156 RepID=A0ABW2IPV0_9PROT
MFLGIDIGTSSVKTVVIDNDGTPIAQTSVDLPISRPKPLWSEQNPADWWTSTNMAVAQLDVELRHKIRAIGLSGQMHGATILDADDRILRPAILWNDGRCMEECEILTKEQPDYLTKGGNLVMPGFTAPKLRWLERNEPEIFKQIKTVLLPKDYVRLRMTGEKATDLSDAAGTLWLDVGERRWSEELLSPCGLSTSNMPKLYEGHEVTGKLRPELAEAWGMQQVPVIAGGGDNAAGAAGVGVINDGEALLSLGTSGVIFLATSAFRPSPDKAVHAFCHALPNRWHLMSVMLSAASCLDWAAKLTGDGNVANFVAKAEERNQFASDLHFLPYLSGERTPHNNPNAKGVLFGIGHDTDEASLAQAVLEGVAFGMADGFNALLKSKAEVSNVSVIGGGSLSLYWGRILSAAIGRPLVYRDGAATGPALGAARLARYGIEGGDINDMFRAPAVVDIVNPRDQDIEALSPKFEKFQSLYKNLTPEFEGN